MEDYETGQSTYDFFVPDYFSHFACKMGACRSACCVGWPVTISQENYFHLLGMDCSPELRRSLDCAMHPLDYPTPDAFACFSHRYDGDCALRMQDGRCALHAELGEHALADVCRLYPRGIRRSDGGFECACANSCEATLELLWNHPAPLTFAEEKLAVVPPALPHLDPDLPARGDRLALIALLQGANSPAEGIAAIGGQLGWHAAGEPSLRGGLDTVREMVAFFLQRSDSLHEIGERSLARFADADRCAADYAAAQIAFAGRYPEWARFFSHMMVNHLFFVQFPVSRRAERQRAEFRTLCTVYALLRFLAVECMEAEDTEAALIDVCAAVFRLVEHTDFTALVHHILRDAEKDACADLLLL